MEAVQVRPFIVDANVLIDYCDADIQILSILSDQVQNVNIARSTFNKVSQLTEAQAKKDNLIVVTPNEAIVNEAVKRRGALAYDDNETLQFALQNDWMCITNDKVLRRECEAENASVIWGLELMIILVLKKQITKTRATSVARKIHLNNSDYISAIILAKFKSQIEKLL